MSIERVERRSGEIVWRVRWRDAAGRNRSRVLGRKRDAEAFDAEVKRRRRKAELAALDAGRGTLDEYVAGTWSRAHAAHLRLRTRQVYASTYDRHISPRLGGMRLREIDAETVAALQGDLIRAGVGPHATRKAMTLLGGILPRAAEAKRIDYNPQRVVRKARLPRSAESGPYHLPKSSGCARRSRSATPRSSRYLPTPDRARARYGRCAGATLVTGRS